MQRILIFGNSGSGKSTLAKKLQATNGLAHLDLDSIAWKHNSNTPERKPLAESRQEIDHFLKAEENWVIEGCYSDLLELVLPEASELIFLNPPIETCIANARARPWEPHKYPSPQAQDANLSMLIDWIAEYPKRQDLFSRCAHERLFQDYQGKKTMYTSNQHAYHP